jgi:hypothetical protein
MPWGMGVYNGGREVFFSASPFNLFWVLQLNNCQPGQYSVTIPDNKVGGTLSFSWGLSGRPPSQEVDLGGTDKVTVANVAISGRVVTFTLVHDDWGVQTLYYTFYFSR